MISQGQHTRPKTGTTKRRFVKSRAQKDIRRKISGKPKDRPQLILMFEKFKEGDTLIVWKLDRLGRSLQNLIDLVARLKNIGATFLSINDSIDTSRATGRFAFNLFAKSMLNFFNKALLQLGYGYAT